MPVRNLLTEGGRVVCLVKPQFEAGREKVGKKGVVRDKKVHLEVVCQIMTYAISIGFDILELSFSSIKGPEGNIEYLLYIEKKDMISEIPDVPVRKAETSEEDNIEVMNKYQEWAQRIFDEQYLKLAKEVVDAAHTELDK